MCKFRKNISILVVLFGLCSGVSAENAPYEQNQIVSQKPDATKIADAFKSISYLKKEDYFVDYIEMRGQGFAELSAQLRVIRKRHIEEISKGDLKNYLDHVTVFLTAVKSKITDPVSDLLDRVVLMRTLIPADESQADKAQISPCADCLDKEPFYVDGKLVNEVKEANHAE